LRRTSTLIVMLVAMAVLLTTAPTAARSKIALGVSEPVGFENSLAKVQARVQAHIDLYDRKPAMFSLWSNWGDRVNRKKCTDAPGYSCFFPRKEVEYLLSQDISPVIWWQYTEPKNENSWLFQDYSAILRGKHDGYIKQWARQLKRATAGANVPVIVRPFHEATGRWFPWGTDKLTNSVAKYKKAWRKVVGLFRKVGAGKQKAKFLWSNFSPRKSAYPGDKFVDYVGFTVMNYGKVRRNWRTMPSIVNKQMRVAKSFTRKPVIIAEIASYHKPKSKASWLKQGYLSAFKKHRQIKGILYLDANLEGGQGGDQPDWRLIWPADNPVLRNRSAVAAYRLLVNNWRFKGHIPK